MQKIDVKSVVWQEEKHYVAQCLNVDVSSFGPTREAALANLDEALVLFFENNETRNIIKIESPEVVTLYLSCT